MLNAGVQLPDVMAYVEQQCRAGNLPFRKASLSAVLVRPCSLVRFLTRHLLTLPTTTETNHMMPAGPMMDHTILFIFELFIFFVIPRESQNKRLDVRRQKDPYAYL